MSEPMNVLFLCTGNSARSVLAEAILNRLGRDRFRAFSAGSRPVGEVNPLTLELLQMLGHDLTGLRSKSWDEFARPEAPPLHFVFTVCDSAAGEACPVWPGQPITAHWGIPDPAAVEGPALERVQAFQQAYRQLQRRIEIFLELPLAMLERMVLEQRLREIGQEGDGDL
ncbi:MAG: arsenate reductase ArsC [bacterium]|jgi:arsenate reductase